ncbi:hypothetical protein H5410_049095 [Solanum commersonii]|uniref:Uncharacterized protein n=1 Tax=Solanum commersonii TaxID=4109 RepID=A0A9J5XLE2_SOLCO|nr:hypothetical protein H5410_049095 [Solanum commersonii]
MEPWETRFWYRSTLISDGAAFVFMVSDTILGPEDVKLMHNMVILFIFTNLLSLALHIHIQKTTPGSANLPNPISPALVNFSKPQGLDQPTWITFEFYCFLIYARTYLEHRATVAAEETVVAAAEKGVVAAKRHNAAAVRQAAEKIDAAKEVIATAEKVVAAVERYTAEKVVAAAVDTQFWLSTRFPPSPWSNHLAGLGVGEVGIREGKMLFISPRRNYLWKSPLQPLDSYGLRSNETRGACRENRSLEEVVLQRQMAEEVSRERYSAKEAGKEAVVKEIVSAERKKAGKEAAVKEIISAERIHLFD